MAPGDTDNLAEMENLDEPTLLNELKVRYNRDTIYVCTSLFKIPSPMIPCFLRATSEKFSWLSILSS